MKTLVKVGKHITPGGAQNERKNMSSTSVRGRALRGRAAALTAAAAMMVGGLASAAAPAQAQTPTQAPTQGEVRAATLYQKHVKSNTTDVTVFKSPTGQDNWGSWGPCTNFYTDRTDGSRYHTWLSDGRDAWVTSDSNYVAPGWC